MFKPSSDFNSIEEERDYYKELAAEYEKRYRSLFSFLLK